MDFNMKRTFKVKIDYEGQPITRVKVKGVDGLDRLMNSIKKKIN